MTSVISIIAVLLKYAANVQIQKTNSKNLWLNMKLVTISSLLIGWLPKDMYVIFSHLALTTQPALLIMTEKSL